MEGLIKTLFQTMDQEAYQFLAYPNRFKSGDLKLDVAAVIESDWVLQKTISRGAATSTKRSMLRPNAIIIDQTIMPSSWSANDKELSVGARDVLRQVVDAIVQAIAHSSSSANSSSSAPTFVLVHENIAEGFFQAIQGANDGTRQFKRIQEDVMEHRELLEGASPGELDFLPVFSVSSFDYALDFVQDEVPAGVATYVFSNASFGEYAFKALSSIPYVFVNQLPEKFLGKYSAYRDVLNLI